MGHTDLIVIHILLVIQFLSKSVFFEADLTHMKTLNPTLTHSPIPIHMKPFFNNTSGRDTLNTNDKQTLLKIPTCRPDDLIW